VSVTANEARQLFGYSVWANALMFAAADGLPGAQLDQSIASSFPSVRRTLAHIVSGEWIWLRRWLGENPTAMPPWVANGSLRELEDQLASVEVERDAFLATLSDSDLERMVSYRALSGDAFTQQLGDLMRHVVNHSTYHRGQVATLLRHLGVAPPGTDLTVYLRQLT